MRRSAAWRTVPMHSASPIDSCFHIFPRVLFVATGRCMVAPPDSGRRKDGEQAAESYDDHSTVRPRDRLAGPYERSHAISAEVFGVTDRGLVRRDNQDQFLVADLQRSMRMSSSSPAFHDVRLVGAPQGWLLIVADGMGGYRGGEVASAITVEGMARYVLDAMPWPAPSSGMSGAAIEAGLVEALRSCHSEVQHAAEERGLDARMGTTLTLAFVDWPELIVLHVGDSRCYLLRHGTLSRLTRDQTLAQQLYEEETLTAEEAARSRFRHVLVNSVGGNLPELTIETHRMELHAGDRLLLCTDGLTGHLDDGELARRLSRDAHMESIARGLVEAAKKAGGEDNITALVAAF